MPVHEPRFSAYRGPLTPPAVRLLAMLWQGLRSVFARRLLLVFLAACFVSPLVFAVLIYLRHNAEALALLRLPIDELMQINASFFLVFLRVQGLLAFLLTLAVAPGSISADLRHNAMPLYLYRPISRFEYVLGKGGLLITLLAAITLVPALVLIGLQTSLEGFGWLVEQWQVALGMAIGCLVWVLVLSLFGLASSALARSRPAAGALLFTTFLLLSVLGAVLEGVLRTEWTRALNLTQAMAAVWQSLMGVPGRLDAPLGLSWLVLSSLMVVAALILVRRIRAVEVVR